MRNSQSGFTIVELMVAICLIVGGGLVAKGIFHQDTIGEKVELASETVKDGSVKAWNATVDFTADSGETVGNVWNSTVDAASDLADSAKCAYIKKVADETFTLRAVGCLF